MKKGYGIITFNLILILGISSDIITIDYGGYL